MSDAYASVPKNLRSLRDRLMHVSRRDGLAFGRLQQHIGVLVVSQFMASLTDEQGQPDILVKGGSALELRRGISQSRASRDLDAVTRHDIQVICQLLAESAARGWEGFTAVLTEPELINVPGLVVKPRRFTAKLQYQGARSSRFRWRSPPLKPATQTQSTGRSHQPLHSSASPNRSPSRA